MGPTIGSQPEYLHTQLTRSNKLNQNINLAHNSSFSKKKTSLEQNFLLLLRSYESPQVTGLGGNKRNITAKKKKSWFSSSSQHLLHRCHINLALDIGKRLKLTGLVAWWSGLTPGWQIGANTRGPHALGAPAELGGAAAAIPYSAPPPRH